MKDLLKKVTSIATEKFGAHYAEARAQTLSKTMFTMKEGRVEAAKQGTEKGVALRVLVNGAWGFASVGSFNAEIMSEAVSSACAMAKTAGIRMKTPIKLSAIKSIEDQVHIKAKKNPAEISVEEKRICHQRRR